MRRMYKVSEVGFTVTYGEIICTGSVHFGRNFTKIPDLCGVTMSQKQSQFSDSQTGRIGPDGQLRVSAHAGGALL